MIEETTPTPRRTRKKTVSSETKPRQKRHRKSGAAVEIDKRIAQIIQERTTALREITKYVAANHAYQSLTAELNELIGMQARLAGGVVPLADPVALLRDHAAPNYQVGGPVPAGVGSIPTPSGNVADLARDKDFV